MTEQTKGLLITVAGVLAITPDGLLVRLVSVDEWTILFWRGALSALAIACGLLLVHRRNVALHFRLIGKTGLLLAVIFALGNIAFIVSLSLTTVANTLFITSSAPIWAALFSRVFLGEAVASRTWVAIGFALFGIGVIASGDNSLGEDSWRGDLSALGAAFSMAATFILARKARAVSMVPAMVVAELMTAAMVLPLATPFAVQGLDVLWLGLMGLVVLSLGSALMTMGPRYLPAPEVGLLMLLEAVLSPLLVWSVVGESPGTNTLIGGAIVLLTLVILNVVNLHRTRKIAS